MTAVQTNAVGRRGAESKTFSKVWRDQASLSKKRISGWQTD